MGKKQKRADKFRWTSETPVVYYDKRGNEITKEEWASSIDNTPVDKGRKIAQKKR